MASRLSDMCVIYESREDGCWIAHGLRTDQIGTGGSVVEALADLIRAIDQIRELAQHDASVAVLRPAPADIQKMAHDARDLPHEIYEIAYRMVTGKWPADWKLQPPKGETFKAEIPESATA